MPNPVRRKKTSSGGATARSPSRAPSERVVTGIVCILLVAIVWIVFGQTLRHEFVNYDDDQYVYENSRITNGLTLDGIQWAFTHVHADNWHPLTTISHMLDCQLYGLQPWGHHLTNVLLHAAATFFRPIHARAGSVCTGFDVQTDAGDCSLRPAAVGLLAASPFCQRQSDSRRTSSRDLPPRPPNGKNSIFCALRRVVCDDAPGPGTGCHDNSPIEFRRP